MPKQSSRQNAHALPQRGKRARPLWPHTFTAPCRAHGTNFIAGAMPLFMEMEDAFWAPGHVPMTQLCDTTNSQCLILRQGMNFIAGAMLLFMEEEDAFWALVHVVEDLLPGYFNMDLIAPQVDQAVFKHLVRLRLDLVDFGFGFGFLFFKHLGALSFLHSRVSRRFLHSSSAASA